MHRILLLPISTSHPFRRRILLPLALMTALMAVCDSAWARNPFSLVSFRRSKEVAKSSGLLTEDNGPWMIFVASFAGEGAEDEARQLVHAIQKNLKLDAYLHKKEYDFTDEVRGKGFDRYGRPKKMRYNSAYAFDEYAVLVGNYSDIDDPKLEKHLDIVKFASADDLRLRGTRENPTTRRFAGLRSVHEKIVKRNEKKKRGPLRAFVTRNPMIPASAVAPQGLDEGLIELNKGVKYSLLKNPGKYTVRVASFRGDVIIDQREIHKIENDQKELSGKIDETDDKAEKMARILRNKYGIEAYVYHDYHESIVTVGSFEEIGRKLASGEIELAPDVAKIMSKFGPTKKPIAGSSIKLAGIQPKQMQETGYLFDVQPQPILVPRKSIASDYASRR